MKNEKEVIEHIKKRYTYDAATGEIRNRKGQVVKGYDRITQKEPSLLCNFEGLSARERRMVCDQLFRYVGYLESVQQMPLVVRLRFFRCVLLVYDFLRKQKQLGRREGTFSEEVALTLVKELKVKSYDCKE